MSQKTQELKDLRFRLSEALRYLEGIETSAFPGLDCGVIELQLAQESAEKLAKLLEESKS